MGFVCKLEDDLLSSEDCKRLYSSMPKECKEVIDNDYDFSIGVGKNNNFGWFIMISGQGPALYWSEKSYEQDGPLSYTDLRKEK